MEKESWQKLLRKARAHVGLPSQWWDEFQYFFISFLLSIRTHTAITRSISFQQVPRSNQGCCTHYTDWYFPDSYSVFTKSCNSMLI
jgi:hypothetical protein